MQQRRAGLPEDVGALIEKMTGDSTTVTFVNTNQLEPRTVTLQAGGYGEHQFTTVALGNQSTPVNGPRLTVQLAPGAGARLVLNMKRYANTPTLAHPW